MIPVQKENYHYDNILFNLKEELQIDFSESTLAVVSEKSVKIRKNLYKKIIAQNNQKKPLKKTLKKSEKNLKKKNSEKSEKKPWQSGTRERHPQGRGASPPQ